MPAILNVKLEVHDSTRNSLISMKNARTAPKEILNKAYKVLSYDASCNSNSFWSTWVPSNPIVNGNKARIIQGCIWKIISIGLCSPILAFCITSWAKLHRIPLVKEAKRRIKKPTVLNSVDLYVNKNNPLDIRTTIITRDQLFFSNPRRMAKNKMNIIVDDFVIVYNETCTNSKPHWENPISIPLAKPVGAIVLKEVRASKRIRDLPVTSL